MQSWLTKSLLFLVLAISGSTACAQLDDADETASDGVSDSYVVATNVWQYYGPRFGVSYEAGEGIGYTDNFASIDAFLPLFGTPGFELLFADLHWLSTDDSETGLNLGVGVRKYSERFDRTFGCSFYYDRQQVNPFDFQQLGFGLEMLGPSCDLRGNVYLPNLFDNVQTIPAQFAGNLLIIDQSAVALPGADIEAGVPIWQGTNLTSKAFIGGYHFVGQEAPGTRAPDATGVRARLEVRASDVVDVDLALQNDSLFDTTFSARVTVTLPVGRWARNSDAVGASYYPGGGDRLPEPVERLRNIVAQEIPGVVARDPLTNQPLTFLHAAPNSFNGDGTFENPYDSMQRLFDDPQFQAGGVTGYVRQERGTGQLGQHTGDVTIPANTKLLSSRPIQLVATQRGTRVLPFSGAGGAFPSIFGNVTLSNGSTFSGFNVVGGTVSGNNITDFEIRDNEVGVITLSNINGAGRIANNDFFGTLSLSGTSFTGDVDGNSGATSAGAAIDITVDTFTGNIQNNRVEPVPGTGSPSSPAEGIKLDVLAMNGNVNNNTVLQASTVGIRIDADEFNGQLSNNRTEANGQQGIALTINGIGTTSVVDALSNTLNTNNSGGNEFLATNAGAGANLTLQLNGNTSGNNVVFPDFNYDLLDIGIGTTFTVLPAGVNGVNVGTVGSSDGSVTIP